MSTTDSNDPYATHWHVITHADDEDPFITYDTVAALDYAATEVAEYSENEHGNALDAFEGKRWEESATAFVASERYDTLARNMRIVVRNAALSPADRARLLRRLADAVPGLDLQLIVVHPYRIGKDNIDRVIVSSSWQPFHQPLSPLQAVELGSQRGWIGQAIFPQLRIDETGSWSTRWSAHRYMRHKDNISS